MMLTLTGRAVTTTGKTVALKTVYLNIKHSTRLEWIA
jgi:hypothetical protein